VWSLGEEKARLEPRQIIGRHRLNIEGGERPEPRRWELLYRTPYTLMVGSRLRRLRESQGLTQYQVRHRVSRPQGGPYSQSVISRLEGGYANAPLYTYIHFAEAYEVAPELLLGPDEVQRPVKEAEMTLLRVLRRLDVAPDVALARLTRRGEPH
jgi:transcriptional regulator with XRE-family HTH domain